MQTLFDLSIFLESGALTFCDICQGIPLLYVPLEAVMSKYYGESERLLGAVFSQANELPDGAIIFLDEVKKILLLLYCCLTFPFKI